MAASLEVGGWRAELDGLLDRFGRLFVRAEPRGQAGRYLEGLLGPVERKNGWQLAEAIGDARPWRTHTLVASLLSGALGSLGGMLYESRMYGRRSKLDLL